MAGVLTDAGEYVLERAMEVVNDASADLLAGCLSNMSDKQATALFEIETLGKMAC